MKIKVTFKRGLTVVAEVVGTEIDMDQNMKDSGTMFDHVIEAEQTIEKLTGLRVHILQV